MIALRIRNPDPDQPFKSPLNLASASSTSRSSRSSAASGRSAAFIVTSALFPTVRYAGIVWLVLGMVVYVVYRKSQGLPLTETCAAPAR